MMFISSKENLRLLKLITKVNNASHRRYVLIRKANAHKRKLAYRDTKLFTLEHKPSSQLRTETLTHP